MACKLNELLHEKLYYFRSFLVFWVLVFYILRLIHLSLLINSQSDCLTFSWFLWFLIIMAEDEIKLAGDGNLEAFGKSIAENMIMKGVFLLHCYWVIYCIILLAKVNHKNKFFQIWARRSPKTCDSSRYDSICIQISMFRLLKYQRKLSWSKSCQLICRTFRSLKWW